MRGMSWAACAGVTQNLLCGSGVVSKMAEIESSLPSLGRTDSSCVDSAPSTHVPEFSQPLRDGGVVPSLVGLEDAGWVLDDDPPWPDVLDVLEVLPEEPGEGVVEPRAGASESETIRSGDAGVLAGEASDQDFDSSSEVGCGSGDNVASDGDAREVLSDQALAVRDEFAGKLCAHAGAGEAQVEAADAGEVLGKDERRTHWRRPSPSTTATVPSTVLRESRSEQRPPSCSSLMTASTSVIA